MERHLEKDAVRLSPKSKKEVATPLESAALDLVTGDQGPTVSVVDDGTGEKKRIWGVFGNTVPRKKADTPETVAPDQNPKRSAPKNAARPEAQKAGRRSERSLS